MMRPSIQLTLKAFDWLCFHEKVCHLGKQTRSVFKKMYAMKMCAML